MNTNCTKTKADMKKSKQEYAIHKTKKPDKRERSRNPDMRYKHRTGLKSQEQKSGVYGESVDIGRRRSIKNKNQKNKHKKYNIHKTRHT